MTDVLIVGQGLAGSLMAWQMLSNNRSFKIIDRVHFDKGLTEHPSTHPQQCASWASTGIVNPITGRRFVKSWIFDDLNEELVNTYKALSELLGHTYFKPQKLFRTFSDLKAENDWSVKAGSADYEAYFIEEKFSLPPVFLKPAKGMSVNKCGRLSVRELLVDLRTYLQENDYFVSGSFDFDELKYNTEDLSYPSIPAKRIIFCEGAHVSTNPLFNYLPLNSSLGESFVIRCKDLELDRMVKHGFFFIPLGNDLYQVGTSWNTSQKEISITEKARTDLEKYLAENLSCSYEIVSQSAGMRPTLLGRRPVVGAHPKYKNAFILNGLGTKGVSIGPYFARQLFEFIFHEAAVNQEVLLNRFDDLIEK